MLQIFPMQPFLPLSYAASTMVVDACPCGLHGGGGWMAGSVFSTLLDANHSALLPATASNMYMLLLQHIDIDVLFGCLGWMLMLLLLLMVMVMMRYTICVALTQVNDRLFLGSL
jgi:hypothetical protein